MPFVELDFLEFCLVAHSLQILFGSTLIVFINISRGFCDKHNFLFLTILNVNIVMLIM